jgi:hypothetical protein
MRRGPRIRSTTKRTKKTSRTPTVISIVSLVHGGSYTATLAHTHGLVAVLFRRENTTINTKTYGVVVEKWYEAGAYRPMSQASSS